MSLTNLDNLDVTVPEPEPSVNNQIDSQPQKYSVSTSDIEFLQKQISITTEQATALLLKNNGNYVNTIIDFYQVNYKNNEAIGISQPTITAFNLDNEEETHMTLQGKVLSYDNIKTGNIHTISKTYLFVVTTAGYSGFTKKKKYCTLKELIDTEYIPNISTVCTGLQAQHNATGVTQNSNHTIGGQELCVSGIELMKSPSAINIYELVGRSNEILEKWSMPSSAIILCPEQIVSNQVIVEKQLFDKLNKVATQIARHSNIIKESESIIHMTYIIGNVDFN